MKDKTMEDISLKKVTAVVSICIMGSYLANANENDLIAEAETTKAPVATISKATTTIDKAELVESEKNLKQFSHLVEKYDVDKNGLLSEAEVKASQSDKLQNHFADIDANTDASISEAEFKQYITQVK